MIRRHVVSGALFLLGVSAPACAQRGDAPPGFHDRVVALLRDLAGSALPPGDTLASWTREPILFHTVARSGDTVRSGMLRGDGMLGAAETRWAGGAPAGFRVRWERRDSAAREIRGERVGSQIRVTGSRDTVLAVPSLPWAVADYGMEDQLVPLLASLPPTGSEQRVAVLRPFLLKWDTVTVAVRAQAGALVASTAQGTTRETLVATDGRLLWLRRADGSMERRPLEGTARHAEYLRLRSALPEGR